MQLEIDTIIICRLTYTNTYTQTQLCCDDMNIWCVSSPLRQRVQIRRNILLYINEVYIYLCFGYDCYFAFTRNVYLCLSTTNIYVWWVHIWWCLRPILQASQTKAALFIHDEQQQQQHIFSYMYTYWCERPRKPQSELTRPLAWPWKLYCCCCCCCTPRDIMCPAMTILRARLLLLRSVYDDDAFCVDTEERESECKSVFVFICVCVCVREYVCALWDSDGGQWPQKGLRTGYSHINSYTYSSSSHTMRFGHHHQHIHTALSKNAFHQSTKRKVFAIFWR